MDIFLNDTLTMKKPHPCGKNEMLVLRVGMDFKLRCVGCGRELLLTRAEVEKRIKKITHKIAIQEKNDV